MTITPTPAKYDEVFPANISRALEKKLTGLHVDSTNGPNQVVPVIWARPDFELRAASFPGIYLSYGPITKAGDREHRGPTNLTYAPPGWPTDVPVPSDMYDKDSVAVTSWEDTGFDRYSSPYRVVDTPVPYNVDFNIGVFSRTYQHNFQITTALLDIERIPHRFGGLEIPEDGTIRTLETIGGPDMSAATDEDGKRLIQTLYTVRVAAELSLHEIQQVQRVQEINITGPWL